MLQMLRDDRLKRKDEGDDVSSSDDERDLRRVDAQLLGMCGQLPTLPHNKMTRAQRNEVLEKTRRVWSTLRTESSAGQSQSHRLRQSLVHRNKLLSVSSETGTAFDEKILLKGVSGFTAHSKSINANLAKQIQAQKLVLKAACFEGAGKEADGSKGVELENVAATTLSMRAYWHNFSSARKIRSSGVVGQEGEAQAKAMKSHTAYLKRFWKSMEDQSKRQLLEKKSEDLYRAGNVTLQVDMGIGHDVISTSLSSQGGQEQSSFEAFRSPRQHVTVEPKLLSSSPVSKRSYHLTGKTIGTDPKLQKEAEKQMERLKAQLAISDIAEVAEQRHESQHYLLRGLTPRCLNSPTPLTSPRLGRDMIPFPEPASLTNPFQPHNGSEDAESPELDFHDVYQYKY
jgi:hypothetical protein